MISIPKDISDWDYIIPGFNKDNSLANLIQGYITQQYRGMEDQINEVLESLSVKMGQLVPADGYLAVMPSGKRVLVTAAGSEVLKPPEPGATFMGVYSGKVAENTEIYFIWWMLPWKMDKGSYIMESTMQVKKVFTQPAQGIVDKLRKKRRP
jgi:hypothetical protein